ncbi:glycosyltransferase family 39 protein [Candidatus Woesearchaeota archaeon]|nr:glycosyltransferase family 39 protein [Candidatus Woesearchaeota archaeon]
MKHKHILAIILILALFFRVVFALIVPVFEKPDEKSHFEYIKYVADNKKLPVQREGQLSTEFFQPPFYHYSASFILRFIRIFTQNEAYQIILLRFVSIFFSMLTLYLVHKIVSLLFKNQTLNLGILAFASFLPSYINFNSAVTNSNLADFLTTLIIYMLLLIIAKGKSTKRIFVLGLLVGISLITRLSTIPIVATIPFAFIVKYYPDIKKAVKPVALISIIALIISGWLFVRNFNLYGDFLGINAMKLASPPDIIKVNLFFLRLAGWTFVTFWASFGSTNGVFIGNLTSQSGIMIFIAVYLVLLLITISSVYGLCLFYKKYRKNNKIVSNEQKKALIIFLFYLALFGFSFVSFNLYDFQPQGRLLFPGISIISIFFTFGIYNLFAHYKANKFLTVLIIFLVMADIASIISIARYY